MELMNIDEQLGKIAEHLLYASEDDMDQVKEAILALARDIESQAQSSQDQAVAEAAGLFQALVEATDHVAAHEELVDNLFAVMRGDHEEREAVKYALGSVRKALQNMQDNRQEADDAGGQAPLDNEFRDVLVQRLDGVEQTVISGKLFSDQETQKTILREFHTLKGESGVLGLTDLQRFCHAVETELTCFQDKDMWPESASEGLLRALDTCRALLDGKATDTEAPLKMLRDAASGNAEGGPPSGPEATDGSDEQAAPSGEPAEQPFMAYQDEADEETQEDTSARGLIQVNPEKLEKLLALTSEVVINGETFYDASMDLSQLAPYLREAAIELHSASRELYEVVASFRMTSVRPMFDRLKRTAYDAARVCNKKIKFITEGSDIEVDRVLFEPLMTAMLHLVRNAIDHGIEDTADRLAAGKSERGTIKLVVRRTGKSVDMILSDDGRGLNRDKIKEKAVRLGLIDADAPWNDRLCDEMIFKSGFSTAARVTKVSGRGVGLDIAAQRIRDLGGRLSFKSRQGQGVKCAISIPLSAAAIEGLVVRLGESRFILPVQSVRETRSFQPDEVTRPSDGGELVKVRNVLLPVIRLADACGEGSYAADHASSDASRGSLLVVIESNDSLAALVVDGVERTRRVVLGPLPERLRNLSLFSGVVTLGGRQVVLVLDPSELVPEDRDGTRKVAYEEHSRPMDGRIETVAIGGNEVGMVDFMLTWGAPEEGKHLRFAVNAFKVREFFHVQQLTSLPIKKDGFLGMLDVRGSQIPVLDLPHLLGYDWSRDIDRRLIMICEFTEQVVGLLVSDVNRVNYISWDAIKPPPKAQGMENSFVVGTLFIEDEVTFLLDYEAIVASVFPNLSGLCLDGAIAPHQEGSRVLLVEDSGIIRAKSKKAMTQAGMTVLEATNGREGLEILQSMAEKAKANHQQIFHYLDLVLLDIEMPEMDGYTLASHIKNDEFLGVLPVIFHSSLTNETIVKRATEVHVDGFVPKSNPEELVKAMQKYL